MTPEYIIIHHSATKDGKTVSWDQIRHYHTVTRGWSAIGYHFGIELIGNHYEILFGRMADRAGAHCRHQGMNRKSIGICVVGNWELKAPPADQVAAAIRLVEWLKRIYGIPFDKIKAHGQIAPTACPGKYFPMDDLLRGLGAC